VTIGFPSASMLVGRAAEIMPSEPNGIDSSAVPEISREELRRRLHDPSLKIVDVLPEASYVEAHIPGALSLPLEQLANRARRFFPTPPPRSQIGLDAIQPFFEGDPVDFVHQRNGEPNQVK
jgi:rhodanese-related sulfurtransferase